MRDGKDLVLTPEILAMFKPDVDGRLHPLVDTSGRFTEKESVVQSGYLSGIQTDVTKVKRFGYMVAKPTVGPVDPASTADAQKAQRFYQVTPATFDGAGGLPAIVIHTGVAGYFGVIDRLRWFCDSTDAAVNLTLQDEDAVPFTAFTPTVGVVATETLAGEVVDGLDNLPMFTSVDNKDLRVSCVDNSGPATGEIVFIVEGHYE